MAGEAVKVAKERRDGGEALTLSTGVRARLHPVPQTIMQDALRTVEEPKVPLWKNPDKDGREEENPSDPDYLKALVDYQAELTFVMFDCCAMFGIELLDGLPEDDKWLRELRLFSKLGRMDLSAYDLEDETDREFLYKRYVAMGNRDYVQISRLSGISSKEVEQALDMFQGDETRETDPGGEPS